MAEEIVKVTSKGQLTIPARIRGESGMDEGSHIYMKSLGNMVIMKKVDDLTLDEISALLEAIASEKGMTRALLSKEVDRIRTETWKESLATPKGARRH
jgi:AbrB family looped-hinge helix DNA binding protein